LGIPGQRSIPEHCFLGNISVVDQISAEDLSRIATGDRILVNADEGKAEIFPGINKAPSL